LTETEVSQRTRISLATLRRWRLENRGPKYYKFGSLVRYGEEELTHWEQTQQERRGSYRRPDQSEIRAKRWSPTEIRVTGHFRTQFPAVQDRSERVQGES
jgi:predicted DNA-binding transcriptional regulator AlpA